MPSRRRRGSIGRREPRIWSRACAQSIVVAAISTESMGDDCDASEIQGGIILADPIAFTGATVEDSRITVLAIRMPRIVSVFNNVVVANGGLLDVGFWSAVVLAEAGAVQNLISTTLGSLLANADVLDLDLQMARVGDPEAFPLNRFMASSPDLESNANYRIDVKRKVDMSQQIVFVWGLMTHAGAFPVNSNFSCSVSMLVSTLWQRTLR